MVGNVVEHLAQPFSGDTALLGEWRVMPQQRIERVSRIVDRANHKAHRWLEGAEDDLLGKVQFQEQILQLGRSDRFIQLA